MTQMPEKQNVNAKAEDLLFVSFRRQAVRACHTLRSVMKNNKFDYFSDV